MRIHELLLGLPYRSSDDTDITQTWRKYGWKPVSELTEGIGNTLDDYDTTSQNDWLEPGGFK